MPIDLTPPVLADRRMSRTANHAATVVVVGAGSAGMTTAWRLSAEPSTHVILIDAGADPGPAVPDSLRREMLLPPEYYWGCAEADTGAFLPRGKVLGGTSAANAAAAVRGHPRCFDAWGPGWTWEAACPRSSASRATDSSAASPITATRAPSRSRDIPPTGSTPSSMTPTWRWVTAPSRTTTNLTASALRRGRRTVSVTTGPAPCCNCCRPCAPGPM